MAKISMFLSFFLFVLIAMPASSSSRMILEEEDQKAVNKCPIFKCVSVCPKPRKVCAQVILKCKNGSYKPCCGCPRCC
ncbi:hypothetical protein MKX01_006841 [Papaver californicum]|nr:hypothetical protein MKX01_006841 [Papaver californicum]